MCVGLLKLFKPFVGTLKKNTIERETLKYIESSFCEKKIV